MGHQRALRWRVTCVFSHAPCSMLEASVVTSFLLFHIINHSCILPAKALSHLFSLLLHHRRASLCVRVVLLVSASSLHWRLAPDTELCERLIGRRITVCLRRRCTVLARQRIHNHNSNLSRQFPCVRAWAGCMRGCWYIVWLIKFPFPFLAAL